MKCINWQKGFFRSTLILSILFSLVCGGGLAFIREPPFTVFVGSVVPFGLVWLVYFVGLFIVRGFTDRG